MHKGKRIVLVLVVAVAVGLMLWIIENRRKSPSDEQEITLMLDWTPNVNHVGIFVAQEGGFFANEGLKVDIIQPGELYAPAAVLSGVADFGIDFQEYLTLLSAEQPGLLSIAAILQQNTSGFAARRVDNIKDIASLNGKRYGSFQSPFEKPTIDALLSCEGVEQIAVEYLPLGTDLLAMLTTQQSDFVWIYWGTQGFQAQRLGIEIDYFPMSDYGSCIPDYYSPIIISSQQFVEDRPQVATAFLRALRAAHQFVVDNPQTAAAMLSRAVPELDQDELEMSVAWLAQYMLHPTEGWGYQERYKWEDYAQWMVRQGIISRYPDIDTLYSNQFLE